MSFKRAWIKRLPIGTIDLAGHCLLAYYLPGYWWFQFIPDLFGPAILFRSFRSDTLLPENDRVLFAHKLMHTVIFPLFFLVVGFFAINEDMLALGLQWALHILLDSFTHPELEFKKNLWWPRTVTE